MDVFVIRHAIAVPREEAQDDASRDLTPDGVRKLKRIVQGMRKLDLRFDRVLTSPWQRAVSTAALLEPLTEGQTIVTDLLCDKPRAELFALIAEASGAPKKKPATAVVGHEPWLTELVGWLAFGDPRHGEALDLKKGGIVWLEGTAVPGGMKLRALLTPKILRQLR